MTTMINDRRCFNCKRYHDGKCHLCWEPQEKDRYDWCGAWQEKEAGNVKALRGALAHIIMATERAITMIENMRPLIVVPPPRVSKITHIALVDVDGHNFPNLALMKLAAWHKAQGDTVEWYNPLFSRPDKIYASKAFTFTPDFVDYAAGDPEPERGGTGYDPAVKLPPEVEAMIPDYSLYPEFPAALGFLTRGCIRHCPWCIVPAKEGALSCVANIEQVAAGRKRVILLDNNFLAAPPQFVTEQLATARRISVRIDFNQGLDARLVNEWNARELAATKWIRHIRFSCDTHAMLKHVARAISLIRGSGYRGEFFVYVLARNLDETHDRIMRLTAIDKKIVPFCQPYRDFTSTDEPPEDLRRLARWCNIQSIRKTIKFSEYRSVSNG